MGIAATIFSILVIGGVYYYLWKAKDGNMIEKFTIWIIFSVVLALAPLLFNAILTFIGGQSPTFAQLLQNGELLIIAVAIGADAIGKLFGSGSDRRLLKIAAGGGCTLLIIFSSLLFSAISTSSLGSGFDPARVASISSIMFFMTVITGGSCTLLSEIK